MADKSYSELRQAAYMRAARELRKVACAVLDDVQTELELQGRTAAWAITSAVVTVKQGNELASRGYECCAVGPRANSANLRSSDAYRASLRAFHERLAAARGITLRDAEELTLGWIDEANV